MARKRRIAAAPNSIVALAHSGVLLGVAESKVTEEQQAELVVAVALWSLRQQRAVDFTLHERWWWPFSPVLAVEIASGDVVGPSLERELLKQIRELAVWIHAVAIEGANLKVKVRDAVHDWLLVSSDNPHGEAIKTIAELAERAGWYPVTRHYSRRGFTTHPARAAELQSAAQGLAADWQRFRHDEFDLADSLMATVKDGFRTRTYARPGD